MTEFKSQHDVGLLEHYMNRIYELSKAHVPGSAQYRFTSDCLQYIKNNEDYLSTVFGFGSVLTPETDQFRSDLFVILDGYMNITMHYALVFLAGKLAWYADPNSNLEYAEDHSSKLLSQLYDSILQDFDPKLFEQSLAEVKGLYEHANADNVLLRELIVKLKTFSTQDWHGFYSGAGKIMEYNLKVGSPAAPKCSFRITRDGQLTITDYSAGNSARTYTDLLIRDLFNEIDAACQIEEPDNATVLQMAIDSLSEGV